MGRGQDKRKSGVKALARINGGEGFAIVGYLGRGAKVVCNKNRDQTAGGELHQGLEAIMRWKQSSRKGRSANRIFPVSVPVDSLYGSDQTRREKDKIKGQVVEPI